jgi:hypothetical protein
VPGVLLAILGAVAIMASIPALIAARIPPTPVLQAQTG